MKAYEYIMTVDDDICILKIPRAPTEMIGEEFKVVAYPLKAVDADHNVPSPVAELVEAAAEVVGDGPA